MFECKASEVPRSEAYWGVRRTTRDEATQQASIFQQSAFFGGLTQPPITVKVEKENPAALWTAGF